jgi:glycogen synthase
VLFARLLGRPSLLKLHYPQYQTVHRRYEPMPFVRRMGTEILYLCRLDSSLHYRAASLGRLFMRTLVALLAHRVCACSRFCAEQASLPRRVHVLRNPLAVKPGLMPRQLADLDQPLRFVFVGRLSDEKGWDTLLDATLRLKASGRSFVVDIIGDGPDRDRLQARLCGECLASHMRWLGRLAPTETRARMTGALAAVVPSRVQEQAGYVAVEAAAEQVVSIVSRAGGLPETAGVACPSFDVGDAAHLMQHMAGLIDDPRQALAAGRAAYLLAGEEFDPAHIAEGLLGLLGLQR